MDQFFETLSDPWKILGFLAPFITFVLGFQIQKRLTRYKEYVSRLHHDLTAIRDVCKQACIDASKLKSCLYKESGHSLEPSEELHQIVAYPTFRDTKLLNKLTEFLKHVDEQRNIFSWGCGSAHIAVEHSSGERVYYEFLRDGNDAIPLPNLTDDEREQLLRTKADQLCVAFETIDRRIEKLLK